MAPARQLPAAWKLGVLSTLYFAQGLPFGFQSKGLKLALTELGLSMTAVTLSSALSLPWSLKPLWGPLVDRHGSERFGRRKSWIVPMQLGLALSCAAAGFTPPSESLAALLVAVFFMNLFAATQDVPVDGLAVDLLAEHELGAGNAVQVVGYKVGMIVGGSVLISQLPRLGWQGMMFALAALCLAATTPVLLVREPGRPLVEGQDARLGWRELVGRLKGLVTRRGAGWVLLFVATYKLGETLADALFEPWLMRVAGYPLPEVAVFGGWAMLGSLLGSVVGGLIASRLRLLSAVVVTAAVRAVPVLGMWALVAGLVAPSPNAIIAITTVEHFFAGMLTTAMFAFMMSQVDRRIGATHFTLLAAVEVAGKAVPGLLAGSLADTLGFGPVFLLAALLSGAFVALVVPLRRALTLGGGTALA